MSVALEILRRYKEAPRDLVKAAAAEALVCDLRPTALEALKGALLWARNTLSPATLCRGCRFYPCELVREYMSDKAASERCSIALYSHAEASDLLSLLISKVEACLSR